MDNRSLTEDVISTTMSCEQKLKVRTLRTFQSGDLTAPKTYSFPVLTEKRESSIPAIQSKKTYHNGSSMYRYDLKTMDSRTPSTMELDFEMVKKTLEKRDLLLWLIDDSVKRCDYKLGRIIKISSIAATGWRCCATSNVGAIAASRAIRRQEKILKLKIHRTCRKTKIVKTENFATESLYTTNLLNKKSEQSEHIAQGWD